MTSPVDDLERLTPANAAVLFNDNQTTLSPGLQSRDTSLLTINIKELAKLARLFDLPVLLSTTGGGAKGPSGPLLTGITDTFSEVAPINRMANLNAMDDPQFSGAVAAPPRREAILTDITTDFYLVYLALSLIAAGYRVFVVIDASGFWTKDINDWALHRLVQGGATPTNVQSIAGELQNSSMDVDRESTKARMPTLMKWCGAYTLASSIIAQNGAYTEVDQ